MAPAPAALNWTNDDLFRLRDRVLEDRGGQRSTLKCSPGGWSVFGHDGLDIWTARRLLNDRGARVAWDRSGGGGSPDA